jgi:hypothetical protein
MAPAKRLTRQLTSFGAGPETGSSEHLTEW